ncbi:hypothetical protein L9F63_008743 [Diploptera punctata]|uniref:Coiled-coil domain-containing protein 40 n=1 Tax=Diploptera punctata TaxID=6984 RepID=A0AAD8E1H5_DIPPU|nr:hypothetical protein L9F63_008743 [Diploptera punctata]
MESGTNVSPTSSTQSSPRFLFRAAEGGCENFDHEAQGDEVHIPEDSSIQLSRIWRRQGEGDQSEVLDPSHPLMKRFQNALRKHLERQYNRLNEEVLELEATIKKKELERKELGINLYDVNQELRRQQGIINKYHETLKHTAELRQEMETQVENSRKIYIAEQEKLNNARKKEGELRAELENLMNLERQFADWEKEMESELAVSERIAEKTKIEKKQLTEEMQKQDLLILKLIYENSNLEAKMTDLLAQYEMRSSQREKLSQAVADANAQLETLRMEQHRLVQSWNSVLILIQQRDKLYTNLMNDYNKIADEYQTLKNEIEGLRRRSNEEMVKNESLTMILNRVKLEEAHLKRLTSIEEEKKERLENELSTIHNMLEQTDKDMERATLEYHKLQHQDKLLQNEVEKLSNEKVETEDKIIEKLQDQITQDKAAKYLNKMLKNLRSKTKEHEMNMVNVENQLTKTSLEAEGMRGVNEQMQISLEELKKQVEAKDKELDLLESELTHCESELRKKQGCPLELKIISMEKNIADTTAKSEQLQQSWLRQQRNLIVFANQRNEQLHNINLMRKQFLILSQKNLKLEYEIDLQNKEELKMTRSIASLNNKLVFLNLKLHERRDYKENLDKENLYTQNQYFNILKDAELEAIKLENEIKELQEEKISLGETLLEKQRELLAWEKQYLMAQETKRNTEQEKSKEGEIGNMKAEIHRMQVRYSQLQKAQEKLIGDLENCVARRDAIVDQTEARERKTYKGSHRTRYNFQKNLENLRTKIKQANNEIKSIEHETVDTQRRKEDLIQQMKEKQDVLQQLEDSVKELEMQIAEGQLQRQKNLEMLVRRQRKARIYGDVKVGRYRLLFRSENALNAEMQKQKTMNSDLISILESLLVDFPALKYPLTKILNTLRLKPA